MRRKQPKQISSQQLESCAPSTDPHSIISGPILAGSNRIVAALPTWSDSERNRSHGKNVAIEPAVPAHGIDQSQCPRDLLALPAGPYWKTPSSRCCPQSLCCSGAIGQPSPGRERRVSRAFQEK